MRFRLAAILWLCVCATASADVRLTQLFSDNMILQQQTSNAVWGFAEPGETVTVTASWGAEAKATANADGDWKVMLKTPKFGTGHSITGSRKKYGHDQECRHRRSLAVCRSVEYGLGGR